MKIKGLRLRGEVYWFRRMVNGKRREESLHTGDLETAIAKAVEIRNSGPIKGDMRLEALRDKWIEKRSQGENFKPATQIWARGALIQFQKFIGDRSVKGITQDDIEDWVSDCRKRISSAATASYLRAVKSFFAWCKAKEYISQNPTKKVKGPRVGSSGARRNFCSKEQRDALIAKAPDDSMRLVLFLGFHAGLRKDEIINARRDWFDLENKMIWVRRAEMGSKRLRAGEKPFTIKDGDERPIRMTPPLREFLVQYLDKTPTADAWTHFTAPLDFVLHPEVGYGKSLCRYDFRRPWTEYMKTQGCPEVTPHTMRRTFASLLVQEGVSLYKVAKWLGDGEAVTAKHYAHLAPGDEEINKMV